MSPGTEFARDFCAGIGPLQFGVVLVYSIDGIDVIVIYCYITVMCYSCLSRQIGKESVTIFSAQRKTTPANE